MISTLYLSRQPSLIFSQALTEVGISKMKYLRFYSFFSFYPYLCVPLIINKTFIMSKEKSY